MKRLLAAGAAVLLVSGLAGCMTLEAGKGIGGPDVKPIMDPTSEPTEKRFDPIEMEPIGLDQLREHHPSFEAVEDDMIRDVAGVLCDAFDEGLPFEAVLMTAIGEGLSADEAGGLTGYAIAYHCLEHVDVIGVR